MAVLSFGAQGSVAYSASGGTSIAPAYPSGITTSSMLVLIVGQKPATANGGTVTTPSGWTLRASRLAAGGYGTTLSADDGNVNTRIYTKDSVTGSESGNLTVTIGDNNVAWAGIFTVQSDILPSCWRYAASDAEDASGGSPISFTSGTVVVDVGDYLTVGYTFPTDVPSYTSSTLTHTAATISNKTAVFDAVTGTGLDLGGHLDGGQVTAITSGGSGTATVSGTYSNPATHLRGGAAFLRLRVIPTGSGTVPVAFTSAGTGWRRRYATAAAAPTFTAAATGKVVRKATGAVTATFTASATGSVLPDWAMKIYDGAVLQTHTIGVHNGATLDSCTVLVQE